MINTELFVTMTDLGRRYGTTAHRVGKILKDWGYRSPSTMEWSKNRRLKAVPGFAIGGGTLRRPQRSWNMPV